MRQILLYSAAFFLAFSSQAQTSTPNFIPGVPSSIGPGVFGLSSPVNPAPDFQIHGVDDYCITLDEGPYLPSTEATACQGLSSIFTMTNPVSGINRTDGMMFRMSAENFVMANQENKQIRMQTGGISMNLYGQFNQLWVGNRVNYPSTDYARINAHVAADNGMYIRTQNSGHYGLTIRSASPTDISFQVLGASEVKNFVVQSSGFVFARKYTTTLANIPDYVFKPDYNLMPLSDLRNYITENQHLPNIPSAAEYEETGVDLGELNRLLLEKIEELTLYTLQLEERMRKLENK